MLAAAWLAPLLLALPLAAAAPDPPSSPPAETEEAAPTLPPLAGSEAEAPAAPEPPPEPKLGRSSRPGRYRIGADDKLRLQVVGLPEFAGTASVNVRGTAVFPILGEVEVGGLTLDEATQKVTDVIAREYFRDPNVLLEVVEYNNMKVWVFGFVRSPGEVRLTGPTTLLELLGMVGDRQGNAGSSVTIERNRTGHTPGPGGRMIPYAETDTITVDLDRLLKQADVAQNVELENGDKIYVPPSSAKVYAFGEVKQPGFYAYREGMTLSDLIQSAGGLTEFANPKKVRIRRANLPKPIQVNLKDFYNNGVLENNIPLTEGDIVLVNSSFLF